ncbi:MAG: aminotransferase class V-fold PLP-dependent enzyme [Puniceicoccaceae bacterium]|nr:MAG: aminotransferase class V-fold PLP-dependent enzyme [Puniceicoccaceae bacterium]
MPYFDHNATAPLLPASRAAFLEAQETAWQNPGSPFAAAGRVHRLLEQCRERIGVLLGAAPARVVITSGATEANATVMALMGRRLGADQTVVLGPAEHPCVTENARAQLPAVETAPADAAGRVATDWLEARLGRGGVGLVSIMAANNESGVLNDWASLAEVCARHRVPYHCDAAQWLGRLPAAGLGRADFVSACAHKCGGPKGVGLLLVPEEADGPWLLRGGDQEAGRRAGTENYPAVAAFLAAWEAREQMLADGKDRQRRVAARDAFEAAVCETVPGVQVIGGGAPRLWNTSFLLLPGPANRRWLAALDRLGFQASTGSACATGKEGPSLLLSALGVDPLRAARALRVSGGWETSAEEWTALARALGDLHRRFAAEKSGGASAGTVVIDP